MIVQLLEGRFSAIHRIEIGGTREPIHGHDFRCQIEIESATPDDASVWASTLDGVLAQLGGSRLEALFETGPEAPSAERIAAWILHRLAAELEALDGVRMRLVTVHEAAGCSATARSDPSA